MSSPNALPLYIQISEALIRDINAGRLMDGERLPPEREMASDLGIAVGTLRKALSDLTEKGFLDRIQGSGNYVRQSLRGESVYAFFRLERVEGGGLPTADVLSVDRMAKPEYLPEFGNGPEAYRIRRLRSLSGTPAAMEEIWLDGAETDSLSPDDLSESLYFYYRTKLSLWIARAEDSVGMGYVPDWSDPRFPVPAGAPAGWIQRRSWTSDGRCPEVSLTWFDPETMRYVARLK